MVGLEVEAVILSTAFKVEALHVTVVWGSDRSLRDSELRKVQSQIGVGVGISWTNPLDLRLMLLEFYTSVPHFSNTSVMDIPLTASQRSSLQQREPQTIAKLLFGL